MALGGVVHGFTLNAKGVGTDAKNSFKLTVKSKKGVVLAQPAKFALKLTKGNFAAGLANDGLTNTTIKKAITETLYISVVLNHSLFRLTRPVAYKATLNKTGTAK